jgi:ribokinase
VSPNQKPSIVVVGSLNRDLVVTTPRLPLPGETVHGSSYSQHNGGKGANQAVALARLGQNVTMVGCVGNDEDGSALVSALEADGVDTGSISRSSTTTGIALITVEDTGQNSIVVVAGANGDLDEAAIDVAAEFIAAADIVLAQFEVPIPSVARAFSHATGTVVLNPAPASLLDKQLLESVDYLIPNRTETVSSS